MVNPMSTTPSEPEEWTETVSYQVTYREHVWKTPEFDYWLMTTWRGHYFLWGPGFLDANTWRAGWQQRGSRNKAFDGYWESDTLEGAVKSLPYRVAVALMEKVKADMPVMHGASRYDHHGCRCDVCKAGKAAKSKASRERQKEQTRGSN